MAELRSAIFWVLCPKLEELAPLALAA